MTVADTYFGERKFPSKMTFLVAGLLVCVMLIWVIGFLVIHSWEETHVRQGVVTKKAVLFQLCLDDATGATTCWNVHRAVWEQVGYGQQMTISDEASPAQFIGFSLDEPVRQQPAAQPPQPPAPSP